MQVQGCRFANTCILKQNFSLPADAAPHATLLRLGATCRTEQFSCRG